MTGQSNLNGTEGDADSAGTAEVQVYEAMWTSQLTQKNKVWNDGVVRFHTFNKRLTLYDARGVLLDSLFINRRRVEQGEVLRFERTLVDIGGKTGTFQQDLAQLRKPNSRQEQLRPVHGLLRESRVHSSRRILNECPLQANINGGAALYSLGPKRRRLGPPPNSRRLQDPSAASLVDTIENTRRKSQAHWSPDSNIVVPDSVAHVYDTASKPGLSGDSVSAGTLGNKSHESLYFLFSEDELADSEIHDGNQQDPDTSDAELRLYSMSSDDGAKRRETTRESIATNSSSYEGEQPRRPDPNLDPGSVGGPGCKSLSPRVKVEPLDGIWHAESFLDLEIQLSQALDTVNEVIVIEDSSDDEDSAGLTALLTQRQLDSKNFDIPSSDEEDDNLMIVESTSPQPRRLEQQGPWTIEALDLMTWRPPGGFADA